MHRNSFILLTISLIGVFHVRFNCAQNDIMEQDYGQNTYQNNELQNSYQYNPVPEGSWFHKARSAIAGPAGQFMVHMAKEMISRQAGNSQVKVVFLLSPRLP